MNPKAAGLRAAAFAVIPALYPLKPESDDQTGAAERAQPVTHLIELTTEVLFKIIGFIVRLAPLGVFGAIAYTVGRYGVGSLQQLGMLVVLYYLTVIFFVLVVLGGILRLAGFSILKFLRYLHEELMIVLGTASSDSVLPQIMKKLEHMGIKDSTVGLVIPTGYSFNLDAFSIYLTLATVFIAHARLVDVEQSEVGAFTGEADRSRAADAVGGAGDEHGLVAQSGVHSGGLLDVVGSDRGAFGAGPEIEAGGQAAVRDDVGTEQRAGAVGQQEKARLSDLARLENTPTWLTGRARGQKPVTVAGGFEVALEETGEHRSRAENVHSHATARMIHGDGSRELADRGLRSVVDPELLLRARTASRSSGRGFQ